ncbi:MAG TPA: ABC transporter permease [Chloroflexus aurantiacus]|jgi:peptide/nickel transport system permease protein|uniref:Binding-protein-dependent transport systems inner membrane component n=1 Tax=Chloroflexus aurantiacus (strain ATCC 29366 / DSM 635 / J-10-fl) TaxID=324602 RepID=A9W9V7_CHLAA|nr:MULTISPECIES: ABC transporter permease [Chloroflexus]ABY34593.1 binding-protein-dependent transport systems inner membrane component [Chloroflexus aurantiacus J-10-fl]RMG46811.1 MAG: ABC transporter permease [Chloroflexota bacterium]GIV93907.1 MAG: ABC transporter permease [Chloroflexus sp.]HBW66823.1 ABC transporter permease [Chloroflexus aurantiacus]
MIRYLLRRIVLLGGTVLISSLIIFLICRLLPGDVARVLLGREAGEAALAALRAELGLDRPLPLQYIDWLRGLLTGDWGIAYSTRQPIRPLVMERLSNSLLLAGTTLALALPLGIGLGVWAGWRAGKPDDTVISVSTLAVTGLPEFVTGLLLIDLFAFRLRWLPANSSIRPDTSFFEVLPQLVLPAITATLVLLAYIARLTRTGVIAEREQEYVRTAMLKGLSPATILRRHVLRNALLPAITVIAISLGWLISGLIVVENVYNYPGIGRLLTFAIDRRDLLLLQAVAMITVVIFAVANLLADLMYALLDPRIRLGDERSS